MASERKRIGKRNIDALAPNTVLWDTATTGFGARRQRSSAIVYFVKYRAKDGGQQRWYKIGRHGAPWTAEAARDEAVRVLGAVANGDDPAAVREAARNAKTVSELCDLYLADADAGRLLTRRKRGKKASTIANDRGRIERHIKPLLGRKAVGAISRADVERFMHDVAEGKTATRVKTGRFGLARVDGGKSAAARVVGLLGAIFSYAVRQGLCAANPVHGIIKFADGRRDRRLTDDEYAALGAALRQGEAEGIWPPALSALRLLALSGWRSGEAINLRRPELDLARRTARLGDTKSGESIRPLSRAACDLLEAMPRVPGDRVFPATRGDDLPLALEKFWRRVAKLGGLPRDISMHTLRHSYASLAADLGFSEPTIAALVGHRGHTVTSRYVHAADTVLLAATDAVANRTAELMGDVRQSAEVVPLRAAQ